MNHDPDPLDSSAVAEELFTVNLSERQLSYYWNKIRFIGASDEECWDWIGALNAQGYGNWWASGKYLRAPRVAYFLANGAYPDRLHICHHCDRPACCNPRHLFIGTHTDNMQDCAQKGRNGSTTRPESRPRGARVNTAKLTEDQVREIRKIFALGGITKSALARRFGIDWTACDWVIQRRSWRHVV